MLVGRSAIVVMVTVRYQLDHIDLLLRCPRVVMMPIGIVCQGGDTHRPWEREGNENRYCCKRTKHPTHRGEYSGGQFRCPGVGLAHS
jgi:hypothetical protein